MKYRHCGRSTAIVGGSSAIVGEVPPLWAVVFRHCGRGTAIVGGSSAIVGEVDQIFRSGHVLIFVGSDARIKSLGDTFVNVLSEADICFRNRFIFPIHGPLSQNLLIF